MTVDRVQGDKLLGMARAFAGPPKKRKNPQHMAPSTFAEEV